MDRQPETDEQRAMRLAAEEKAREARAAGKRPKSDVNVEVSPREALAVALGVEVETLPAPHFTDDAGEPVQVEETAAGRRTRLMVKLLSRLDAALVDAVNAELAEGADADELAVAFASLPGLVQSYTQERVAQLLPDPVHPSLEIVVDKKTENAPTSCPSALTTTSENPNKNDAFRPSLVDNSVHLRTRQKSPPPITPESHRTAIAFAISEKQKAGLSFDDAYGQVVEEFGEFEDWAARMHSYVPHTCPSPDVDPELITERVYIMCEAGDVSETEAAQIARRDLCEVCAEAAKIARSHVTELEYASGKYM
jgi:hypothetical protein